MLRLFVLSSLLGQALLLGQADPALLDVQHLIDTGKISEAEDSVRHYLETHEISPDAHYLLGYVLFREGQAKASIAECKKGEAYRTPSALDLEVIGVDYFLLENYPAADESLTKSVALAPNDAHVRYYLGRAKYNEKSFADAALIFAECLKLDPKNVKAADYLGRSYEALGKADDALEAYRKAVESETGANNPESFLDLGSLLTENNRGAEAIPYLSRAARIAPDDWQVHRALGKAYLELNRLPEAVGELRKAAGLSPENAPLHFLLAQALRKSGLINEANAETERFNSLTGTHSAPDTPLKEARSLLDLGNIDEAEQVTRRYVDLHKNSPDGHYLLAYILFKKQDAKSSLAEYTEAARYRKPSAEDLEAVAGDYVLLKDYPDADKWFSKAVEWNPQDSLGWYYLGRTKYNENRFDEAISAFEQCLKLDPRNVKAEDNLGLSFEGLNELDKAEAAYRRAIDWQKDVPDQNPGPCLDLGSLLVDNNQSEAALPYLLGAERLSPGDYRVHRQLGKAYTHLNQLEKARAELEQAISLAPQNAPVHFMLAQIYRKQGLLDKARIESDKYSELTGGPQ